MGIANSASTARAVFGLFGAGGFSREVMPFASAFFEQLMHQRGIDSARVYFVETRPESTHLNGVPLISEEEFFSLDCDERFFNIAAADSKIREKIADLCLAKGATPLTVQAASSSVYVENKIADGAILCGNTIVTSNATIGKFFHANLFSYVAHDCVIGDYVTFAPRVHCNGNVVIGNHAYVGTCAVLKQGTPSKPLVIGEGAVIGMGAVVTKDVPAHTTVVGNPAKPFERR